MAKKTKPSGPVWPDRLADSLEREGLAPVYLFAGDEGFYKSEGARLIRGKMEAESGEIEIIKKTTADFDTADVYSSLLSNPLFGARRLVIVHDGEYLARAGREQLKAYLDNPSRTNVLVVFAKSTGSRASSTESGKSFNLQNAVAAAGTVVLCLRPDDEDERRRMHFYRWICARASVAGLEIEEHAVPVLVELLGANCALIDAEIKKIASAGRTGRVMTENDVRDLVDYHPDRTIWNFLDAVGYRNTTKALSLLEVVLAQDSAHSVIAALASYFRKLLTARELERGGADRSVLERATNRKGRRFDSFRRQYRAYSIEELADGHRRIAECDYLSKSKYAGDVKLLLERLVVELVVRTERLSA